LTIESVHVRNFQSLIDTKVELGVLTVILGPNDQGKSAFFRAIRSAVECAAGTDFITYDRTMARVTLVVDGRELIWETGASVNRYILDGLAYEKVGRQVPPDIQDLLALSPVQFDKNLELSLNFADQDDPPFLIPFPGGLTSAGVAKILGDLTNLNVLYRAVGEAERRRRQADSALKMRRGDVESLQAQVRAFPDLTADQKRLESMTSLLGEVRQLNDRYHNLSYARNERESFRKRHDALVKEKESLGDDPTPLLAEVEQLSGKWNTLTEYKGRMDRLLEYGLIAGQGVAHAIDEENLAAMELRALMDQVEICPLCEQPIQSGVHEHAAGPAS
jgi:DNA repair ATPase RecN